MSSELHQRIVETHQSHGKIAAVKLYREVVGGGLREALDAVEAILQGRPLESDDSPRTASEGRQAILDAITQGRKVGAIKLYRESTGCDLKEAKDFIEALTEQLREENPEAFAAPKSGCAGAVLLLWGSAGGLLAYFT